MQSPRLISVVLAGWLCLATISRATAAEPTTVALTLTRPDDRAHQDLGLNLLSLVELGIQSDERVTVVERRQIDRIVQEHMLDRSRPADPQLQLGKLLTADCLAMLEFVPQEKRQPPGKPVARLRVVDAKTAAIRGLTVASIDEAGLEEAATQFAAYLLAVLHSPDKRVVTVAVAPFESKGRFDRLRPLELGVRDLVTARLLELSGASTPKLNAENGRPDAAHALGQPSFQVVQRSNLEQLLSELDLIRSGFADKSRLPETLPTRAAAYLIRGELDERQEGEKYTVVVRGDTVQVATLRVVDRFELECPPNQLPEQLAGRVDALARRLWIDQQIEPPARLPEFFEIDALKRQTLADLRRFRRIAATTREHPNFIFPGQMRFGGISRPVETDTPLGRHLLEMGIDRLESTLLINPDDVEAAYALGFCYSIHQPGIYRPERAEAMLRKASALSPGSHLAALALLYLSEISYDDRTAQLEPGSEAATSGRLWFAFENMPPKFRDHHWAQLLSLMFELDKGPAQGAALADLLRKAAPFAAQVGGENQYPVAGQIQSLALRLIRQARNEPALAAQGAELLEAWAVGSDPVLAEFGRQGLAMKLAGEGNHLGAARAYEEAAARIVDLDRPISRERHFQWLLNAAQHYQTAGQAEVALHLLQSFEIEPPPLKRTISNSKLLAAGNWYEGVGGPNSLGLRGLVGQRGFQIGNCYEKLGDPEKAHQAYLAASERCPTIVDYSDIVDRIVRLGGVPRREDCDVEVKYFPNPLIPDRLAWKDRQRALGKHLAGDGRTLFLGSGQGIYAFDLASQTFRSFSPSSMDVTCLAYGDGVLWAGTAGQGLWQCSLASGAWSEVAAGRLPDRHIECIALRGPDAYVGVGSEASGGLVLIDSKGRVEMLGGEEAPPVTPTHLVVRDNVLLARTREAIYQLSFESKRWTRRIDDAPRPSLFGGRTTAWGSSLGKELSRWDWTPEQNEFFKSAWYTPENNQSYFVNYMRAGFEVDFVSERGDEVWFGGDQWERFVSSGLYRFNTKTGQFHKFTPADGFKPVRLHRVFDGLWVDDQLWLVTTEGLCRVTPRDVDNASARAPGR